MIVPNKFAQGIYIGQVYHDAWIDFHEEGTEAAAATTTVSYSVTCSAKMRPQPVDFHADHPFLFAIVHNKSYSILFAGYRQPQGLDRPSKMNLAILGGIGGIEALAAGRGFSIDAGLSARSCSGSDRVKNTARMAAGQRCKSKRPTDVARCQARSWGVVI